MHSDYFSIEFWLESLYTGLNWIFNQFFMQQYKSKINSAIQKIWCKNTVQNINNKTEKSYSLQDNEKEVTIMTK